jgi:hypothetical protein
MYRLIEYAPNVLGMVDAPHAETNPEDPRLLIAGWQTSLARASVAQNNRSLRPAVRRFGSCGLDQLVGDMISLRVIAAT